MGIDLVCMKGSWSRWPSEVPSNLNYSVLLIHVAFFSNRLQQIIGFHFPAVDANQGVGGLNLYSGFMVMSKPAQGQSQHLYHVLPTEIDCCCYPWLSVRFYSGFSKKCPEANCCGALCLAGGGQTSPGAGESSAWGQQGLETLLGVTVSRNMKQVKSWKKRVSL